MKTQRFALVAATVLTAFSFSGLAQAQTAATQPLSLSPSGTTPATAPASGKYPDMVETVYSRPVRSDESQFARNHFDLTLGGQGFTAHGDHGNDSIGFVTFGFDYFFVDDLSIGLEVGVSPEATRHHHHHDDEDDDGIRAVEEMALLRWHFLKAGGLSLYADGGAGGMHADPDFPSGGRRDSFLTAVGGGLTLRLSDHWLIGGGARAAWLYGERGRDQHGHHWADGVQYYGEVSFVFP